MMLPSKKEEAEAARSVKSYALKCSVTCAVFYWSKQSYSLPTFKGGENTLYFLVEDWQGHTAEEHVG